MGSRSDLQTLLLELVPEGKPVYFQPPPNFQMDFPCIIYNLNTIRTEHADNRPYSHKKRWSVTVIDADPDSDIPNKVADIPTASFDRHFVVDNLNHDVFTLFF